MAEICMMPGCEWEVFKRSGLCDKHYAEAFPKDTDKIRKHIEREHENHETSMAVAKAHHHWERDGIKVGDEWLVLPKGMKIAPAPKDLDVTDHAHFTFEQQEARLGILGLTDEDVGWKVIGRMNKGGLT